MGPKADQHHLPEGDLERGDPDAERARRVRNSASLIDPYRAPAPLIDERDRFPAKRDRP